jgi:type IV secretion system protein VirB8
MNKPDTELQSYFRDAQSWADDRQQRAHRSQRIAWIIAGVTTTIAALEAIALAGLIPLKTVVPMTVLVDRQTGHVTTLDPSQPVRLAPDSALARSMLAQYVAAREGLDRSTIAGDYRKVALWSGESAKASYFAQMKAGNPENPLVRLPRGASFQTVIKSISLIEDGEALVRYDLVQKNDLGNRSRAFPYVSVVHYRFRDRPPLTEADRFINPLGFEVTSYRKDPEAPPAAQAVAADPQAIVQQPTVSGSVAIKLEAQQ